MSKLIICYTTHGLFERKKRMYNGNGFFDEEEEINRDKKYKLETNRIDFIQT